jgi:RNA polymerase sigma-70 factor, ECF subfamily
MSKGVLMTGKVLNSWLERRFTVVPPRTDMPPVRSQPASEFDRLFARHYAVLTRIAYRIVGDAAWAEEVAAEAFWKLHRNPPRYGSNVPGWLYRTALRLALDHLKACKRRTHYEAQAPPPAAVQSPAEAFDRLEQQHRVRQILTAIKATHAELLILRSEGYKLTEIAAIQGINPKSVGMLLARADEAFRKEYVKRYGKH